MKYKVTLRGRVINEFFTWRAADKFARAYNKHATGTFVGATVEPPVFPPPASSMAS